MSTESTVMILSCLPLEVATTDEINVHQPAKESGYFKEDLRVLCLVEVESGYVFDFE